MAAHSDLVKPKSNAPLDPAATSMNDVLESLSLSDRPLSPQTASSNGFTPDLPPAMAAMHGKTGAEMLAELNKLPLFMTELEENDDIEALKALAYEGTPAEVGQGFKERGNECFKEKKWADAKEFYTRAIQVLQAERQKRARGEAAEHTADEKEVKEQLVILEACLGNRSACHVHLQNYRSCTLDCAQVLRLNPKNLKAYLRSGTALLALNKIAEADDACAHGLALDPQHADLLSLARKIVARNEEVQARREKEARVEQQRKKEEWVLRAALKARNIRTRATAQPPEMEDARVRMVPDAGDPTSSLVFPTVLLYPVHLQSDFVKEFGEMETVGERVGWILEKSPPWDVEREYSPKGVECYMETIAGGLIKVGKSVTLLKVLGGGNVEVVDDVVRIFVVPKGKAEAWIREFKQKKAAEKGNV